SQSTDRRGTDPLDRMRRGSMSLGRDDHLIARPDAKMQICQMQSRHAGTQRHTVGAVAEKGSKLRLECSALRAMRQNMAIEYLHHRFPIVVGDPGAPEGNRPD